MIKRDNIGGPKIVGTDDTNKNTLKLDSQNPSVKISIQNKLGESYHWHSDIIYDQNVYQWLRLSPPWSDIAPGKPIVITVEANPKIVEKKNTYTAKIYLYWDGPSPPVSDRVGELDVTFTVS